MIKKDKGQKGITLIALVVTIIVLLILAGISIAMLTGQNGILVRGQEAATKTEHGTLLERLRLEAYEANLDDVESYGSIDMYDYFLSEGIMTEDGIINKSYIGENSKIGTGDEDEGNYYKIEDGYLCYVTDELEEVPLGKVFEVLVSNEEVDDGEIFKYSDESKTTIVGIKQIYTQRFETSEENDQKMLTKLGSTNKLEGTIKLAGSEEFWGKKIVVHGEEITKIVIPDTVVKIAESVFFRFVNIESVQLDANLREIGDYAFDGCEKLNSITLSDDITYLGTGAFDGCERLTSIHIPTSITEIKDRTFVNSGLTSVTIPSNITKIGASAFSSCNIQTLDLGTGVQELENCAFGYNRNLTNVTIPSSVRLIGGEAFNYCNLQSLTIEEGVTEIQWSAFNSNGSLSSVTLPASVMKLGSYAFPYNNEGFSITIKGKTGIGDFTELPNEQPFGNVTPTWQSE